MPVVFRLKDLRFHLFSNEGNPREPVHIHAESADGKAKLWLYPEVKIASSAGFNRKELTEIVAVVHDLRQFFVARRDEIERAWNEYFG